MSTEPYTPEETEVATVWQAQYGDGDAGVGKTLRREGEESWARFIAKVKADALREAAGDIEDRENCYNDAMSAAYVPGEVGRSNVIHAYEAILEEPYSWLRERADRIEREA